MKTNWWEAIKAFFKNLLDKNTEQESYPPGQGPVVTAPVESAPIEIEPSLTGSDPFDYPWKNPATQIVIDAYESNPIDWDKMATDKRVVGVIHRSADGLNKDKMYDSRRAIAKERGYLWGAFHLGRPGNTIQQAELFLKTVDDETLLALDLEDTSNGKMMTIDEAVVFMNYVYTKTGKVCVVYANDSVTKALNDKLKNNLVFNAAKLWYARFKGKVTDFPKGIWSSYFLWQFSSEINCSKDGTCLYNVPGTRYDMDINVFFGSRALLEKSWNNSTGGAVVESKTEEVQPLPAEKQKLWYDIAKVEIGQKEITGPKHNQRILEYHKATSLGASTDEVPWCSSFVSWCLEQAGVESTKNAWARSYLNWGKKITTPELGCIVVFKRGTDSGHVAFFVKKEGSKITVLGGNQSNQVCIADYKESDLLGYRMPNEY